MELGALGCTYARPGISALVSRHAFILSVLWREWSQAGAREILMAGSVVIGLGDLVAVCMLLGTMLERMEGSRAICRACSVPSLGGREV